MIELLSANFIMCVGLLFALTALAAGVLYVTIDR